LSSILASATDYRVSNRVQKTRFLKKAQTGGVLGFYWVLGFIGCFGLYWVFRDLYLNEQLGSLLVDLTHQLSFYLDSPVLLII